MNGLIIDNEPTSRKSLILLLKRHCQEITNITTAECVDTGLDLISKVNPEIVFLKIEMPHKTGFDLLDNIEDARFLTCFVTSNKQHAIKAIEYGAFGFLVKPIKKEELQTIVTKAQEKVSLIQEYPSSLSIKSKNRIDVIKFDDIIYMRAEGGYTEFYLQNNSKKVSSKNIGEYESILPSSYFFRTHKSFLVNLKAVKRLTVSRSGQLELMNGEIIPVSSRKLQEVKKRI